MNKTVTKKANTRSLQQRAQETKAKILSAALSEFAKSGFDGVSTRSIATNAGVNHTLISHHFGSKDALWKATAEWFFNTYNQEFLNRPKALNEVDATDKLRIYIRDFIEFCVNFPDFTRFMMQANQGDEKRLNWLVDRFLSSGSETELGILQQAQKLGLILKGDSLHMRYLFIGAATSIFTFAPEFSRLSGKDPFSHSMVEQHIDYLLALFSTQVPKLKEV
ncbi:TetR/AcrR family transcriptional regulator [Paraglaciecola sp. 2405UD69-4]|uniref:TetR/AcrR family transcriptional regulator n=1 Tax=Paraglaciecola sp. 2405UD69-4 TaxID=3391836 RepID=UPI0039C9D6A9